MDTSDLKNEAINIRCSALLKKAAEELAAQKTNGNISDAIAMLIKAAHQATHEHGNRVIWPPELNHYPSATPTAQDLKPIECSITICDQRLRPKRDTNPRHCYDLTCLTRQ